MLGGGMRQAGVLAAAAMLALEEGPRQLLVDHANARFLAQALAEIPGIAIDPPKVVTNILFFDVSGTGIAAGEVSSRLAAQGILANAVSGTSIRMVTHRDVNRAGCECACQVLRSVIGAKQKAIVR
jgi:threonine aldolase